MQYAAWRYPLPRQNMALSICTLSLGSCAHHSLYDKLRAAKQAGFDTLELYYPDYLQWERTVVPGAYVAGDQASLRAARKLKSLCQDMGLKISLMQPIMNFEGCLNAADRQEAMSTAEACLRITSALAIPMVLIASRWQPAVPISYDLEVIAKDLGDLADYASSLEPPVSLAYEAIGWGEVVNRWQQAWEAIRIANRPNLGLTVDTFNWLAREYADPSVPGGVRQGGQQEFEASLQEFLETVPGDKIFFLQIADGRKFARPLMPSGEDLPLLLQWSRKNRLFPFESTLGAYLPILPIVRACLTLGYNGPLSLEVFNASLHSECPTVPAEHAKRGMQGLRKMVASL